MATEQTPITSSSSVGDSSNRQRRRYYRGGFSTSICDIFNNPNSRTDCCAVACCGVLSSDRNRYLLTGKRPPSLWIRVLIWFIIPSLFIAAMSYFAVDIPMPSSSEEEGENEQEGAQQTTKAAPPYIFWPFVIYMAVIISYGFMRNQGTRKVIMQRLYEERASERGEEVDPQQMSSFLLRHNLDIKRAHTCWSCCYTHDYQFIDESGMVNNNDMDEDEEDNDEGDFCSKIWGCLSRTFWCCGCWFQCFGCCGIAQEEREVNRLTGHDGIPKIDYITFQPYEEYYPAIVDLRGNQNKSLWAHMRTISELSSKLLKNVLAVLVFIILFALSDLDSNFSWENLIILFLTLGQAFFIEYLVHWRYNRFNLSFDSVVKYFGCGFLLTTPMAVVFEMVISTVASAIVLIVGVIILANDSELSKEMQTEPKKAMKDLAVNYPGLFIFMNFVNAFAVAALCEEFVKYFGYRMVQTPCFSSSNQSLKSTGSAITVAMVSVSLGFACCENLIYIFVYSPPGIAIQASTLLARSFFPVHPLCAAIQSIGVCKRDLEGDKRYGLGWISLPAIMLHGSFDFVLMIAAYFYQVENIKEGNDDDGGNVTTPDTDEDVDIVSQLPAMICGLILVVVGYSWYVFMSRAQTKRLAAMDAAARDQNSLLV